MKVKSRSPEQTQYLGGLFGEMARPGDILLLTGGLGVGKTTFTQGIARGLGVKEHALSPSFVIVREYRGRLPLYHMDFYRLDRIEEIADLGLDEYLYGAGMCVIEWAEKGLPELPADNLVVRMGYLSSEGRTIDMDPRGRRYEELVEAVGSRLNAGGGERWNWQ